MTEIWKPIEGYEGLYEVSNLGRIRSIGRTVFFPGINQRGFMQGKTLVGGRCGNYKSVSLRKDGKPKTFLVHRLVAQAFIKQEPWQKYVNHIDNNPQNNCADNLEWCTQSHNIQFAYDNGTKEGPNMVDIDQLTLDGKYITTWHGIYAAGKALSIQGANIWKVCKGERQQAGGFKWRYTQ